jgi:hypothetical protein
LKIIISSVPLLGHLNTVLAIGRALVEEGHKVASLSATAFRERVERIGAAFDPFPEAADIDSSDMIAAYPEFATLPPGPEMTRFYFQRVLADPLAAQHQGLMDIMKDFNADLIVTDNLFMGGDRRGGRAVALAHLERQGEERPAQHRSHPQGHACLPG